MRLAEDDLSATDMQRTCACLALRLGLPVALAPLSVPHWLAQGMSTVRSAGASLT
jgi:hypothetical protein